MNTFAFCNSCESINRVPIQPPSQKLPICGRCKSELPIHNGVNEVSALAIAKFATKSPLPLVVDFWAPWCGPCKTFAPTFQNAARELVGQIVFAKINTEAHPMANNTYGIKSIPTLILFKNGNEIARQSGALPLNALLPWLKKAN
jgi:thioredoxin 2